MLKEGIELGYDLPGDNKDYGAIAIICCNCKAIMYCNMFSVSFPEKCPDCGVSFQKTYVMPE